MEDAGIKLSVIIPAYNAEKYIERCVNSIANHGRFHYEIIIVNDGSTDNTGALLEQIRDARKEVRVIHKENGGQNRARKEGLKNARGKYIAFLDSDDWVDRDLFDYFIGIMEDNAEIDICISPIVRSYCDGSEMPYHKFEDCEKVIAKADAIEEMIFGQSFRWELASKVYRQELFSGPLPEEGAYICEDLDWNWEIFKRAGYVFYSAKNKYHYFMNAESVTQNMGKQALTQHLVYGRILHDTEMSENVRAFFQKAYTKMFPRLLLETITEAAEGHEPEITEYQKAFMQGYAGLEDKDIFDRAMVEAINGTVQECIHFFAALCAAVSRDFREISESGKDVYIYGTGFVAEYLDRWKEKFPLRFNGYVVSDGQPNPKRYKHREVKYLSELPGEKEGPIFVLAMARPAQVAVENYLKKNGYVHFYRMNTAPFSDG